MATVPTPEKIAREILSIFVGHFNCRAREVLRINNFLGVLPGKGLRVEDFKPGMEFAAQQEWVEILQGGGFISPHGRWFCCGNSFFANCGLSSIVCRIQRQESYAASY